MSNTIYRTTIPVDQLDIDEFNPEQLVIPLQLATLVNLDDCNVRILQVSELGEKSIVQFDISNVPEILSSIINCYYGYYGKHPLPIPGRCEDLTSLLVNKEEGKFHG